MSNIVESMTHWRQSDANFVNSKFVWFIHRQFLDAFGKAFIVDATTVTYQALYLR